MKSTAKQIEVSFTTDKNGKPLAYRFCRSQMRNFRVSVDQAKLWIATERAREIAYWPMTAAK